MPADSSDWEEGMQGASGKWKDNVSAAARDNSYSEGIAAYLGVDPGQVTTEDDWESGVSGVSEEEFNRSVSGKGDKWARNYERGVTR